MVVLTDQSLVIIETNFNREDGIVSLHAKHSFGFNFTLTMGVVVPPYGAVNETEVWCYSSREKSFKVMTRFDMLVPTIADIPFSTSEATDHHIEHVRE